MNAHLPLRALLVPLTLALVTTSAVTLASPPALAWQDLAPDFVKARVAEIDAPETSPEARQRATWTLLSAGRAAVDPLIKVVREAPELAWTAVHLLDAVRTDASVVRAFSAFLDHAPAGLASTGEVQGFLSSRLEDMVDQRFASDDARRAWVAKHVDYLEFLPAKQRFRVRAAALKAKTPLIPTPAAEAPSAAAERAFHLLLMALHSGYRPAVEAQVGPDVKVASLGGRVETTPQLDLDAFADSPMNHRAFSVAKREGGWLVRTGDAYFHFSGEPEPRCVRAGMKPIE
ncbi:MAG: hypothetical protein EP329_23555 [Deltaproteobacteria bacterium]|nr:MAG: hypothetical protein EP329_23555 [Deltaproteobacteria bacterium]